MVEMRGTLGLKHPQPPKVRAGGILPPVTGDALIVDRSNELYVHRPFVH
jgi:hypothetical protein